MQLRSSVQNHFFKINKKYICLTFSKSKRVSACHVCLHFCVIQFLKVFSFEKNSKGTNPPGPLSFITLDSKTEEELPSRLVSHFRQQSFNFFWRFKVCSLLVPFPWELGQCWTFPHLRINRGTLVHCKGLVLGREGHH